MLGKLLAAFILIPLVEFTLLVKVAAATSFGTTFLIVIATGAIGSILARREGLETIRRFQLAMGEGRVPSREIQDGLMIVFAGALLLTPGLITDTVGFILLVPAGRLIVRTWLVKHFMGNFHVHVSNGQTNHHYDTANDKSSSHHPLNPHDAIDVEVVRKDKH